jgi:hypothetical protein
MGETPGGIVIVATEFDDPPSMMVVLRVGLREV